MHVSKESRSAPRLSAPDIRYQTRFLSGSLLTFSLAIVMLQQYLPFITGQLYSTLPWVDGRFPGGLSILPFSARYAHRAARHRDDLGIAYLDNLSTT